MRLLLFLCASVVGVSTQEASSSGSGGEDRVFVEIVTPSKSYFVNERIQLRLRFGVETEFLRTNLIQPFRNRLDLPVRVEARWIDDLPGTINLAPANGFDETLKRLSYVLNDSRAEATQVEDHRIGDLPYTAVEIRTDYLPDQPGVLEIPGPLLRFSHTTRFVDSFLNGRVPEDTRHSSVTGSSLVLKVEPLPEEGRPREFTNAVGQFSVRAESDSHDLEVGKSFNLTLRIEGEGNTPFLETPSLDELDSFHVYGKIEDIGVKTRTVTFDIAPLTDSVTEIPSIPFAFFDPNPPAGYKVVRTQPIPVAVQPLPGGQSPGEDNIFNIKPMDPAETEPARSISPVLVIAVLLIPVLFVLGFLYRRRVHLRNRIDPAEERARGATTAFRSRIDNPETDVADALAEYLAAHLRCPVSAVIAPELRETLIAAGVQPDLATRTATTLHDLVDARFGGDIPADSAVVARELVELLDPTFQPTAQ
jgi:hypothetical protein